MRLGAIDCKMSSNNALAIKKSQYLSIFLTKKAKINMAAWCHAAIHFPGLDLSETAWNAVVTMPKSIETITASAVKETKAQTGRSKKLKIEAYLSRVGLNSGRAQGKMKEFLDPYRQKISMPISKELITHDMGDKLKRKKITKR